MSDELTQAYNEQLSQDLADKAAAQQTFVWDTGYYLAQYNKHTVTVSDKASFERKDGSGSFDNPLYNVPVTMFVFNLFGVAPKKGAAVVEFDKPKGFAFRAAFRTIVRPGQDKLIPESVNGGLLTRAAMLNGAAIPDTNALLGWLADNMVVLHITRDKEWTDRNGRLHPESNTIRSITPYTKSA